MNHSKSLWYMLFGTKPHYMESFYVSCGCMWMIVYRTTCWFDAGVKSGKGTDASSKWVYLIIAGRELYIGITRDN